MRLSASRARANRQAPSARRATTSRWQARYLGVLRRRAADKLHGQILTRGLPRWWCAKLRRDGAHPAVETTR